jgi:hypothetical protein
MTLGRGSNSCAGRSPERHPMTPELNKRMGARPPRAGEAIQDDPPCHAIELATMLPARLSRLWRHLVRQQ